MFVLPFLVLLFLLFACGAFVLGQEEGLCLWLSWRHCHSLRGGCFIQTLHLSLFFFYLLLSLYASHSCDGLCLLEQHTHLGAATCHQKLQLNLSTQGYYQKGGPELLLRIWRLLEWTNITISWMFLFSSFSATACVTQKEPAGTQEVQADRCVCLTLGS